MLLSDWKICVPRCCVKSVLYSAHDVNVSGHFGLGKILGRLDSYHWGHKAWDVRRYVDGFQTFKQKKDG